MIKGTIVDTENSLYQEMIDRISDQLVKFLMDAEDWVALGNMAEAIDSVRLAYMEDKRLPTMEEHYSRMLNQEQEEPTTGRIVVEINEEDVRELLRLDHGSRIASLEGRLEFYQDNLEKMGTGLSELEDKVQESILVSGEHELGVSQELHNIRIRLSELEEETTEDPQPL